VFACLALGLLAKPVLVTLPCVLLLLDAWPRGKLARGARNPDPGRLAQAALAKLPLFALAALASWMTWRAQAGSDAVVSLERLALSERVANALVAYAIYLRQCFWPSGLAVIHPHPGAGLAPWQPWLAAALLACVSAFVLRAWPRRGWLAVGWLWFLGMLVPTIGIVQVGSQAHADRYLYLPLVGIAIAVAWSVPAVHAVRRRAALAVAAAVIVASLFVATRLELRYWRDSVALFERAIAVTEDNAIAHAQLAAAYEAQGRLAETIRHYREAVRIRPQFRTAANNLAWLLATAPDPALRDPAAAVELAERAAALSAEPEAAVLDTLAVAYASAGRFDDAVTAGERAVRVSEASETPAQTHPLRQRLALYRARRFLHE
jgi:tetratricopeptide (TPR) repeat protein